MYAYRPYTPSPTGNGYAFWSGFSHPAHPDGSLNKDITIVEIPQAYYVYQNRFDLKMLHQRNINVKLNNYVDIIEASYRDELNVEHHIVRDAVVTALDIYFKICHPSLMPFKIVIVDTIEDLGSSFKTASPGANISPGAIIAPHSPPHSPHSHPGTQRSRRASQSAGRRHNNKKRRTRCSNYKSFTNHL